MGSRVLALLYAPAHQPSERRQVDTEVLGDVPGGVSARGIGRHHGSVSFTAILGDLRQRRGRQSALRPRNAQRVTRNLGVALHARHKRFVSQVDLPAQPLLGGLPYPLVDKAPIPAAPRFPRRPELAQQPVHRQSGCWHGLSPHRPMAAPGAMAPAHRPSRSAPGSGRHPA